MRFKSQAEGPIELLVAVIIMAITIAMGITIYGNISTGQCYAQVKGEMTKLKDALHSVAINAPPAEQSVNVILPNACGNSKIKGLHFASFQDPKFCGACGTTFGGCFQIIPVAEVNEGGNLVYKSIQDSVVCVELPGGIVIKKDTRANLCSDLNDNACLHGTINCNQNYDPNDSEVKKLMDDRKLTINTVSKSVDSVRGYSISLRKSIVIEGGQAEKGQISVCANEIK